MAAGQSTVPRPDRKEITAAVASWVAALVLSLSSGVLRADQAMLLAVAVPTIAWAVLKTYAFRRWFTPQPVQAGGTEEESSETDTDADEPPAEAKERWGIHRRWLLGIVTPVIVVILLSIGYGTEDLVGVGGARIPEPLALVLLFAVVPWLVGLVVWLLLIVPGGLIVSGLRPGMSSRGARIFGGMWAYVGVAFGVTAAQGADVPTYGRPGWMRDGIAILLGFNEAEVTSPGWMWAARVLFFATIIIMPLVGIWLAQRSKRHKPASAADGKSTDSANLPGVQQAGEDSSHDGSSHP